jgi:hypothetical protein
MRAGTAEDFVTDTRPGPASNHGSGGIERPVDCRFGPDGRTLYALDFGVAMITEMITEGRRLYHDDCDGVPGNRAGCPAPDGHRGTASSGGRR